MRMGPGSGYWPPKLLSLREETPLLALPERVELLPPSADWGLVGEPGIGWSGDWREKESESERAHLYSRCLHVPSEASVKEQRGGT